MIILFQHVQSNLYYCDWMLKSRLWQPKYPCELNSTLNLDLWFNPGQNIASDSSTLDARIVTAISLSKTYDESSITYKLLDLAPTGELSNAHIFMNTTVTVSEKMKGLTVYTVPFGSVQGSFDNVSVSGYVNLTISDFSILNEVFLSRMFGFIPYEYDLTNYPAEYTDEFIFRNVSSSLKFFVNGVEIKENVTINGVQFNISNGFDDSAVNVSNSDYQIQNDQNMHHFTYELTDSVTKETTDIKAWFAFPLNQGSNDNSNALDDLYPLSFQMSLEKFYETKGMMLRRFNATGFELEYPFNNVDFVIYQENTKAVYMKDSQIIECNGNDVFDVKTRKCITRDACYSNNDQFLFQSTCVSQCPNNFVTFNKTCWVTCPQWLGAYLDVKSNQCVEITNNQYAIPHGEVQNCLGFVFKKGCYVVCPVGTITQGKTCSEPTSVSQCASNEYLILTGQVDLRYYSVCSPDAPSWMYRIVDQNNMVLNVYKSICSGVVQINNDCQEAQSPNQIKANGLCLQECGDGEYPQPLLQTCHECLSNIYDGGLFFERNGYKCINSCSKWSLSGTKKICEDKFPNNCPLWQVISAGQFLCQTSCTQSQFQDGQVCSSCDPSLNKQVDKVNGGCLCKSGYFTKNIPDGSFTCTECDTTLNFKPSKEGSSCVCIDKYMLKDNKCIPKCLPTQVILSGASACSTCAQNTVPNVAQDGCVGKTSCAPGFLNVAGTFCVSSCSVDSSIEGSSNQCVSCASKDPLSQFSSGQCVCVSGAARATSSSLCACNQNFTPASGSCSCSKKLSSDGQTCSEKCPIEEVSINGNAQCSTCASKVSNVDQTACVDKTGCSPGFLNMAQTHCVSDCAQDKATAGSNNQCVSCSSINDLSVFGSSSCICAPNAIGSGTSCACNTANGFTGAGCSCSKKLSADGSLCKDSCPTTEVYLSGASSCSTCAQNTVPNVAQDGCVGKTSCAPGFLNVAGTFCVSSCSVDSSIEGSSNQCVSCASKDPLSQFSSGQCVCVSGAARATSSSLCACNQNFTPASGSCSCSKKLSSDGQTCSEKCPIEEVSINGNAKCSTCTSQVSNVDQTACVDKTGCSPGFLNIAQTHCVSDCAQDKATAGSNNQCVSCSSINALSVFGSSSCICAPNAIGSGTSCACNTANGFSGAGCSCSKKLSADGSLCKDSCPTTEVFLSGASACSTCAENTVPNVAQDGCVAKTRCAPGFLNVAGTFCVSSCSVDSSIEGSSNQCVSCASKDPLSQFSSGQCVCVSGAARATSSSLCACNQNFTPASGSCSCSKKLSSDGQTCSEKCPIEEVSINNNAQCSTCASKVSNVDQTACVDKTGCSPGFLNMAHTHCVSDCAQDKATAGSNNQCVSCSSINDLSVFGSSSCICAPNAIGSGTSCACNTANGFTGAGCSCSKKLSADGSLCKDSCPTTEVYLSGASSCSTCAQNTVPNVAQDGCVGKTSCAPGFLNVAGTFCVSSCSVDSSIEGSSNQCVSCASKDPLSQFSSGQCVCVSGAARATSSSLCACNQNFTPASGSCSCSKKLSSDGQTCSEKCPIEEVSINGNAQCSTCASKVSNVDQTVCVDKTGCSPGFLNMAQTHCVSDCAQDKATAGSNNQCVSCSSINDLSVFGSSSCICAPNAIGSGTSCACNTANGFTGAGCSCSKKLSADGSLCKDSCPTTEVYLSGASSCSTCAQNTVPNVAQDGCVGKTSCAPGFLNVAGTFCVSSCSVDSSIEGSSNQCVSCASKDPLSQFSSGQCVCVSGAARATSSSLCACNQNFTPASGSCSCSKKLSSDGQTCSEKCPASEVALGNGVQCSVCQSGQIANEAQTECKQIITSCPSNQYIALNKYQCVSTCEKSLIDGNNCVAKCTGKLADVSNTLCVPQCSIYQEEKAGSCVCIQGYAVSGKQCACDSDGGYSIIDGSCKCDESKGRKWKNNQCGCNDLLGYFQYPGQNKCACKKELGFLDDGGLLKCLCDYNRGFFALPLLNANTGYFGCQCDSTRKYVNDTSAATLTCMKRNKSGALLGGIIGGVLVLLIIIIVLAILYKKKRSKKDDKLVNLNKSQKNSRKPDSTPKILNLKDPKQASNRRPSQLKMNPIRAPSARLSSPRPVLMQPQSLQSLSTETSPEQDEYIDYTNDVNVITKENLLIENAIDQSNQFKEEIQVQNYTSSRQSSQLSSHSNRSSPDFKQNAQALKPKKIKRAVINDTGSLGTQNVGAETIKKNIKMMQQQATVKQTVAKGLQPMKKTIKPDKWQDII
ncbi:Conserved_hypothetical protein [Hexamita inflata]|uniref:EGF-like domain-containing protein n=1 Tax=Hexamita inflata TaxID=28002 RepID=A0AA86QS56_9EUKA|nr:Conserved hypothetical protein [Hexamita inflata]